MPISGVDGQELAIFALSGARVAPPVFSARMADVPRGELVVEDRGWPLLLVRFPAVISTETMRAMVVAIERAYERHQRFAAIVDTSPVVKFPDAQARQILTDWVADPHRAERDRTYTVCTAVVISSGPLRALTAAINLVRRPVSPQQWMATLQEAAEWTKRRLLDEGIAMTPGADTLYAELASPRSRRGAKG